MSVIVVEQMTNRDDAANSWITEYKVFQYWSDITESAERQLNELATDGWRPIHVLIRERAFAHILLERVRELVEINAASR